MPLGVIPQAVDKQVAAGFHASPGKLARKVFDIAARRAILVEKSLCPQAEPEVRLQPPAFFAAPGMSGALDPAARQRTEAGCADIHQSGSGRSRDRGTPLGSGSVVRHDRTY